MRDAKPCTGFYLYDPLIHYSLPCGQGPQVKSCLIFQVWREGLLSRHFEFQVLFVQLSENPLEDKKRRFQIIILKNKAYKNL